MSLCSSGSGGIVPLILKLGSACRWVVSCIAQEIQPPSPPYPFNKLAGLPEAVWTFRERQKKLLFQRGQLYCHNGALLGDGKQEYDRNVILRKVRAPARACVRACAHVHVYRIIVFSFAV